jgi:hypothetical protein
MLHRVCAVDTRVGSAATTHERWIEAVELASLLLYMLVSVALS